jgi:hypothetical protein
MHDTDVETAAPLVGSLDVVVVVARDWPAPGCRSCTDVPGRALIRQTHNQIAFELHEWRVICPVP